MPEAPVNAVTRLNMLAEQAHHIADCAEQYLAAMNGAARPAIEVGGFYSTYDGSFVTIVRRHTKCTCATCMGRSASGSFDDATVAQESADETSPVEHVEVENEPLLFVAVVLRGGHGQRNVVGEKPGDAYTVDAEGLAMCTVPSTPPGIHLLTNADLLGAAMSLKQRFSISTLPVEPAGNGAST